MGICANGDMTSYFEGLQSQPLVRGPMLAYRRFLGLHSPAPTANITSLSMTYWWRPAGARRKACRSAVSSTATSFGSQWERRSLISDPPTSSRTAPQPAGHRSVTPDPLDSNPRPPLAHPGVLIAPGWLILEMTPPMADSRSPMDRPHPADGSRDLADDRPAPTSAATSAHRYVARRH